MKSLAQETAVLDNALTYAKNYIEGLANSKVNASATLDELRARFLSALPEDGTDACEVIDQLVKDASDGIVGSAGGRFFAYVIGGALPASVAADWLTSVWDQNAAMHASSPAEGVIEEVCGAWLKDVLHLPASASFALTTGSQMAHVVALAAARHALLARVGWDVEKRGLRGAPEVRILTSDQYHGSLERALRILGLGRDALVRLESNEQGKLPFDLLQATLDQKPDVLTVVVLQAGDLNTGVFDNYRELIALAHSRHAWVHIDGAFGLWTAASDVHRYLVEGIDDADSWVTDGHKWLNVPYDCGYVFVADRDAHFGSVSHKESYLARVDSARDPIDWNAEWSRRGRSVATYAALKQLGRSGVADLINRTCRFAGQLVDRIGALDGGEVVWRSEINQGLVRFLDPRPGAGSADHDARTDAVISAVTASGEAFFGGTTWRGQRCMRISVCNWRTTSDDVERTVAAVAQAISSCRG
ncbi:aspartate aminotransferase family protein [Paraburkholderia sp. UYCP14C]|uniref:pyridoxal phosphate-dependent decarboxylase family protein n=1 Tax=Paraburkholderia sp. UYCP14C TaxID=2511130 RepID=UPI0010218C9A|nr:aminotransferase class V-fold PLP-dependent enzyme [Paraburkholderia sp. UYCP14C]RZF27675.1 aspartate aminotransferase family protein [Paraburkholderia sp. UYCP14C]